MLYYKVIQLKKTTACNTSTIDFLLKCETHIKLITVEDFMRMGKRLRVEGKTKKIWPLIVFAYKKC